MATGVVTWSTTAASNSTADSNVNWAEGQAPSSVNDSARAMMASMAKFRDDTNGSIATGGTSTAYTVTSNQSFASLSAMDNAVIAFIPHTTAGAAPTLAVDGLTAKKIRMVTGVDLTDGVLVSGSTYVATYEAGVGEFLLHNFAGNPWLIPLGVALPFFGTTSPNASLVLPYGQAISRTTYSTLFTMFSTTFGAGDGSTTFNVPDLRGRVPVGKDNMGGSAASRIVDILTGTTLGGAAGTETHTLTTAQIPAHTHSISDPGHTHTAALNDTGIHSHSISYTTASVQSGSGFAAVSSVGAGGVGSGTSGNNAGHSVSVTAANTGISTVSAGGGTAHSNLQPSIISNYLMRII